MRIIQNFTLCFIDYHIFFSLSFVGFICHYRSRLCRSILRHSFGIFATHKLLKPTSVEPHLHHNFLLRCCLNKLKFTKFGMSKTSEYHYAHPIGVLRQSIRFPIITCGLHHCCHRVLTVIIIKFYYNYMTITFNYIIVFASSHMHTSSLESEVRRPCHIMNYLSNVI